MRAIFISYRRDDSEGHAGRLFEDLCDRFGKDAVFMDVAGIEPGRDFRRAIEQQVASCGVLLAVIGKNWLTVADAQGRRRIDDPSDFVRLETAGALKRDIPVIPVLVQQADMPGAADLPDDLKDLAFRNGVELSHARWASDVKLLVAALMPYVDSASASLEPVAAPAAAAPRVEPPRRGVPVWVIAPLGVIAAGAIGYVVWDRLSDASPAPTVVASTPASLSAASSPAHEPAVAPGPVPAPAPAFAAAASRPIDSAPPAAVAVELHAPERAHVAAETRTPAPVPAASHAVKPRHPDTPAIARAPAPALALAPALAPAPSPRPAFVAPSPAPAPIARAPVQSPPPPVEIAAAPRDPATETQVGVPGAASMVARTIAIGPDTKYVNVTGGEVVRFQLGAQSFVWNFSGTRSSFDLARVAPPSLLDHKVTVYVAANPLYPKRN